MQPTNSQPLPDRSATPAVAWETGSVGTGGGAGSAVVDYDHATRDQIMGIICGVAEVVNVSEVRRCADRVMATMARSQTAARGPDRSEET